MSDVYSKSESIASRVVDGEAVLVSSENATVKILNSVGSRVWELIDGERTNKDITELIHSEFDISSEKAAEDLEEFFVELRQRNLIK